jgi:cobalt/nickel transport system permease protein
MREDSMRGEVRPLPGGTRRLLTALAGAGLVVGLAQPAYAMHIAEGFLPPMWAGIWFVASLPFFVLGLRSIQRQVQKSPQSKLALGMAGAYSFVLSSLKIPSVTGSCSHPTGVALGAILFGPTAMTVLGTIVLIFQAILLAHGGLTTLGANVFSMAVVGPYVAYYLWRALRGLGLAWSVFLAATVSDLVTYLVTAVQLALAFPAPEGGVVESFVKFTSIFAVTQIPLAISEGILTVIVFNLLAQYSRDVLVEQGVLPAVAPAGLPAEQPAGSAAAV